MIRNIFFLIFIFKFLITLTVWSSGTRTASGQWYSWSMWNHWFLAWWLWFFMSLFIVIFVISCNKEKKEKNKVETMKVKCWNVHFKFKCSNWCLTKWNSDVFVYGCFIVSHRNNIGLYFEFLKKKTNKLHLIWVAKSENKLWVKNRQT